MSWLLSFLVSVISGVAGLVLAGFVANACVSWYSISSREGASGYFVVFVALCGGVLGWILGLVTARCIASFYGPGFGKELLGALSVLFVVTSVAATICRIMAIKS